MKKQLLLIIAACFASVAAFAQWTEPEVPTTASTFEAGHLYRVRNADGQEGYLAGGYAWYTWNTSTILLFDLSVEEPITYTIEMDYDEDGNELGYTFVNSATNLYTFISGELSVEGYEGLGEMHMDGASSNYSKHYDITLLSGTTYQISVAASDTIYGETKAGTCWGYMPNAEVYIGSVYPFLDPSNSDYACTWEFIDMTAYQSRLSLYNALVESTNYSDMDQSVVADATEVYNNASATVEELDAATLAVKTARNYAITKDASTDNPVDATVLIENPDFETGGTDGWYCSYTSGVNAQNIGYQSASYTNSSYTYINHEGVETNPYVSHFIEAWTYTTYSDDAVVGACIGDGELSQTIKEMPKGNWKLSADVIASQQYETVAEQYGVQLFATSGDYDMSIDISTGNGVPEHVELLFASTGDDLTLGLRTQSTNCNWICADNFELICYGDEDSAYKFILETTINEAEAAYPDMNEVHADAEVKAAYEAALAEAQSVLDSSNDDEELEAASDALSAAVSALNNSVSEYASVADYIEYVLSVEAQADENGWTELVDDLSGYREGTLEPGHEDGTLTSETIAEMEDVVSTMIADFLSEEGNMKAGDDVSILIRNNDFDTDFSGWTVDEDGATPAWGGLAQGENTIEGAPTLAEIASGNAEVYWAAFDISQTIKSMPEGLYTLSCQAFERCDGGGGIHAELYAQLEGMQEQSTKILNLYDEGTEEQQYSAGGEWYDDVLVTLNNGESGYVPNGMSGANVHFYEGHYYNYFNILVTERGDLTIGIRNTNASDWVLFDTFRLVYQGNDASVYEDYILELIAQAEEIDPSTISNEVDAQVQNALDEAYEALDDNDADKCVAAIQTLQAAISAAEASAALVQEIEELYDYTNDVRIAEAEGVNFNELIEVMDEVSDCLYGDGFETDAQIEELMEAMNTAFNADVLAYAVAVGATESNPVDVTSVILTASCLDIDGETSYFGWDLNDGTGVGTSDGCVEIYNQEEGAGISQVLYNLSAGYYILGVQAFYRPGNTYSTSVPEDLVENDTTAHYADLYAGGASKASSGVAGRRAANSTNAHTSTRILSIYADAETYESAYPCGTSGYVATPNTMTEASYAFDLVTKDDVPAYQNYLQFEVAEDGTDVPVGIDKTGYLTGDWLIWSNWTLQYIGTTEPAEDPTTAVEGVEGSGDVVAKAIYGVNGVQLSHLTKGVNIVKTTLSDGTVKVTKILVK